MEVFFERSQFTICDVPVPRGYPQSQTHCGIAISDGKYYLTTSPYPAVIHSKFHNYFVAIIRRISFHLLFRITTPPDAYENPCLYIGTQNENNQVTQFSMMQESPLIDKPLNYYGLPAFNSDPDIFIERGIIYVLNRSVYRTELLSGQQYKYVNRLYLIEGEDDDRKFKMTSIQLFKEYNKKILASPCLCFHNDQYRLFELESLAYNDGITFNGLYMLSSPSLGGLKVSENWVKIEIETYNMLPWHMSIFSSEGKLYSIIACVIKNKPKRCWLMLGEFNDELTKLHIYKKPLSDYNSYRSSAIVHDGIFTLYNATVGEKIKGGHSVDGREILVASDNFCNVLNFCR